MSLPRPIITVLADFEPLFTAPTWKKVVILKVRNRVSTRTTHGDGRAAADGTADGDAL